MRVVIPSPHGTRHGGREQMHGKLMVAIQLCIGCRAIDYSIRRKSIICTSRSRASSPRNSTELRDRTNHAPLSPGSLSWGFLECADGESMVRPLVAPPSNHKPHTPDHTK